MVSISFTFLNVPNSPDRNYNSAVIMHDETHDGVGSSFPWTKVTLSVPSGYGLTLTGSAVTTGKFITVQGDGLTTGALADLQSNSADTTARSLVIVKNDNALAVGVSPIEVIQDGLIASHFKAAIKLSGLTIWVSDGTTPHGNLGASQSALVAAGDICLNATAGKTAYCSSATSSGTWQVVTSA